MEHSCPRFAPTLTQSVHIPPPPAQYSPDEADPTIPECTVTTAQTVTSDSPCNNVFHSPCHSPTHIPQQLQVNMPIKRKRSVNPQADENFVRALEAVRFGGIGFCKAARMYGVNNRTLWLEYKKRGYPINRPSIKNRVKQEFVNSMNAIQPNPDPQPPMDPPSPTEPHLICTPPQPMDIVTAAFSNDFPDDLRPRYTDTTVLTAAQINMHGINFS